MSETPAGTRDLDAPLAGAGVAARVSLQGRTALITGASRGIGKATALALAEAGAKVMLVSRKEESLELATAEIRAREVQGEVAHIVGNAGEVEDAHRCVAATVDRFGPIDILVNNAAANPYHGPLIGIDDGAAEKTVRVNLLGPIAWIRCAIDAGLGEQRPGTVINVASIGGLRSEANLGFYNATKAALIHLTTQLAHELGPDVRVNCVAPGLVKTDMARRLWEADEQALADSLPLRRLGEPQDIATAVLFLAGDLADWITGQTLVVDGGALTRPVMG